MGRRQRLLFRRLLRNAVVLEAREDVVLAYPRAYLLATRWKGSCREYYDNFNLEDERPSTRFSQYLSVNGLTTSCMALSEIRLAKNQFYQADAGLRHQHGCGTIAFRKFVEIPERLFQCDASMPKHPAC